MTMHERVKAFVGMPARVMIDERWYVGNLNMGGSIAPWDEVTFSLSAVAALGRAFPDLHEGYPRLFTAADVQDVKSVLDRDVWLESVYFDVHKSLGGDPSQQGRPERVYGGARFIHAAAYKPAGDRGEMMFSVQRLDLVGHPTKQLQTSPWRTIASSEVATELIALCEQLG